MKQLISLISTKGKTNEQAAKEIFESIKKYEQIKQQVSPPESLPIMLDKPKADPPKIVRKKI